MGKEGYIMEKITGLKLLPPPPLQLGKTCYATYFEGCEYIVPRYSMA